MNILADDGFFAIRHIVERREFQKDATFGFVYLEKGVDTVERELRSRWMEAEIRMVDHL